LNAKKASRMRRLLLILALLACAISAHADTLADLRKPSSTIPGCVNDWGPLGTGAGVIEPTCESKAALAQWNRHAIAVYAARDVLVHAADVPATRTDPRAVIDALNACAEAVDALARLYHPKQPRVRAFADVLTWMRPWFSREKLPI
jgi:hypothetical protein